MKKIIFRLVFISLLFLSCIFTANAQWQEVLKSGDGPIFPYRGNLLCTGNNYLYISNDTGNTWKITDSNPKLNGAYQFASIDSLLFTNIVGYTIDVSADSGKSWKPTAPLPMIKSYTCSGNNLLVGTISNGMYLSKDYGKTWDSANSGLPQPTPYTQGYLQSFINMGNNTVVFCGNSSYITYNHGLTWVHKADNCPGSFRVTLIGNDIYEVTGNYIFRSSDSTLTWTKIFSGIPMMEDICTDGHYILAADLYLGVIFSKDSGDSWTIINNGLPNNNASSVAILGSYIFCGCYFSPGQIFRMPLAEAITIADTAKSISSIKTVRPNLLSINIYPDPIKHSATVDFGRQLQNGNLQLFNAQGQRVQQVDQITDAKIVLQPNNLPAGTYTYIVSEQGTKLATGKLIIQ